jgi:hypothetical protein
VNKQALRWIVAGGLLISSQLAAEPLEDLQLQLAGLRNDQPIRLEVDVELEHRGSAPLHLNKNKERGRAIVDHSPNGTVVTRERSRGSSSTWASFWRSKKHEETTEPLVSWEETQNLANPVGMLDSLLREVEVVSEERVSWQGQPARLLVLQHAELAARQQVRKASTESVQGPVPVLLEAKLWLDESGVPLSLESTMELRLTAALSALAHQSFTFQQVDGRLLIAEARESHSGTALAVLRSRESKTMKVTVLR